VGLVRSVTHNNCGTHRPSRHLGASSLKRLTITMRPREAGFSPATCDPDLDLLGAVVDSPPWFGLHADNFGRLPLE
jgi:hypothetical protein